MQVGYMTLYYKQFEISNRLSIASNLLATCLASLRFTQFWLLEMCGGHFKAGVLFSKYLKNLLSFVPLWIPTFNMKEHTYIDIAWMPLTCHQKVGKYIYLLLCPPSMYYYSADSHESKYKPKGNKPKPADEKTRIILIG